MTTIRSTLAVETRKQSERGTWVDMSTWHATCLVNYWVGMMLIISGTGLIIEYLPSRGLPSNLSFWQWDQDMDHFLIIPLLPLPLPKYPLLERLRKTHFSRVCRFRVNYSKISSTTSNLLKSTWVPPITLYMLFTGPRRFNRSGGSTFQKAR
jgi:hypothetical protein